MSPQNQEGSGGGDGGRRRRKRPTKPASGVAHPAVTPEMLAAASRPPDTGEIPLEQQFQPVPIVLSKKTLITLTIPAFIAIVAATSGFMLFYHKVNLHMVDQAAHVTAADKSKFQTKKGCEAKSKTLIKAVSREIKMSHREIEVKQREQIQTMAEKLSAKQEERHKELMRQTRQMVIETRRARRAAYGR